MAIKKSELLGILGQRTNFGFHLEFGYGAVLMGFSSVIQGNERVYKVRLRHDDGNIGSATISLPDFSRKGLRTSHPAAQAGAPVFVVTERKHKGQVFFLRMEDEILALLRINTLFLKTHVEKQRRQVINETEKMTEPQGMIFNEDLCLKLMDIRELSPKQFIELLNDMPNKRQALKAADDGEILKLTQNRKGDLTEQLEPEEIRFLINIIRARYYRHMSQMNSQVREFSYLGKKVFLDKNPEFSEYELRSLMGLASQSIFQIDSSPGNRSAKALLTSRGKKK